MFKDLEFKVRGFGVFNGLGFRDLGDLSRSDNSKRSLILIRGQRPAGGTVVRHQQQK